MANETLTPQDYQQALNVQDACNPSGVLHSWMAAMQKIRKTPEYEGTDWERKHPINVLFAYKMASLFGQDHPCLTVDKAWAECEKLSKGEHR